MQAMDFILYGGIVLGVGAICSLGYRMIRGKRQSGSGEKSPIMDKINDFYALQDKSNNNL